VNPLRLKSAGKRSKARYSRHYSIDEDELSWLGERVAELGRVVDVICARRIEALGRSAEVS
jgi:hypothetical protein